MQKIRTIIFMVFLVISAIPLFIGSLFLSKKQIRKVTEVLDDIASSISEGNNEPKTIEDAILLEETNLTQEDYERGTNRNLSVECRMCGENTKRGKFYKRIVADSNETPYLFICRDCYHLLPQDKSELTSTHLEELFQEKVLG